MNTLDGSPEERATEITDESSNSRKYGPIETGINVTGLALTLGGSVISLIRPEIGYFVVGAGAGLVVGGLAVGHAIRHGNG